MSVQLQFNTVLDELRSLISLLYRRLVDRVRNIRLLELCKSSLLPYGIRVVKQYWYWALYFLLFRQLYRIVFGIGAKPFRSFDSKRSSRRKKVTAATDTVGAPLIDSNKKEEEEEKKKVKDTPELAGASAAHFTFVNHEGGHSSEEEEEEPQVIVGDDVIIVNKNNRYVEVYEKKRTEKVDNVDDQVEKLLKEFASQRDGAH